MKHNHFGEAYCPDTCPACKALSNDKPSMDAAPTKVLVNGPDALSITSGYAKMGSYHLAVGDKVTSKYNPHQEDVVRTITQCEASSGYGSGAWASADGGEKCPTCNDVAGNVITGVDASWFVPVQATENPTPPVQEVVNNTSNLSELELRQLQLKEIRAMLRLPVGASHQTVIDALRDIGHFDNRVDLSATPERYR
jgi:hypothetical protein